MGTLSICLPVPLASMEREQARLLSFPTRWHMALVSSEILWEFGDLWRVYCCHFRSRDFRAGALSSFLQVGSQA